MKFLLLSLKGDGLGLALHLKQNGHKVATWIRGKVEKLNYDGLIEKVEGWENYLDKDTIVIFDSSGGGKSADRLRAKGHHVFAGSVFADQLEIDRQLAFELLDQAGVQTPVFHNFYSWEDGRKFAKGSSKKLVFKPSGETSEEAGIGSYVSSSSDDLITMLDYFEGLAKKSPEFILQEFKEGVAVSTEGWFNGQEFIRPFNHTLERKSIMNDDLGPSTGCAFNCVWECEEDVVVREGIFKMSDTLREYSHVGPIDLNTIVNEEGVWALEFTPRFGYDALPAMLELFDGDLGEFLASMARSELPEEMKLKSGFSSALRISVPPHPSDEFTHRGGVPVQGFLRTERPHLYFYEVMLNRQDKLVTAKGSGAVVAITSHADSISDAFTLPYELANKAKIPNKQFRTDAVKTLELDYARLQRYLGLGYNQLKEVGGNV